MRFRNQWWQLEQAQPSGCGPATIGQCRDPGGWHRPPPASRAGTDGDPAPSIVSVERGRASEGGSEGRQSEIDAHNWLTVGEALDRPVSRVTRLITPATPARTHPWRKRILAPTPVTNTTAPPCTMKFLKNAAHEISTGLLHNLLAACLALKTNASWSIEHEWTGVGREWQARHFPSTRE